MTQSLSLLPAALRIAERRGMTIPAGLEFGLRSVHSNFESTYGFRWPFPGHWAEASGPFTTVDDPCPQHNGDGLCVALSWFGMSSGGIPAATVLLVGYKPPDVLAASTHKLRAKRAFVIDVFTPIELINECRTNERADLQGANLERADLWSANLQGANLQDADLRFVDLRHADLQGADLRFANLQGANLQDADLRFANLQGADLQRANLRFVDLQGAYLQGADLQGANLRFANLRFANLRFANLRFADLQGADLQGADLQGADLQGADLQGADLHRAVGYTP